MTLCELSGALVAHKCNPTGNGSQLAARCPAHEDGHASLSVSEASDGKLLVHCHAGCKTEDITAALGVTVADLFPATPKRTGGKGIVATYDYRDETGKPLFQVCRMDPKDFRQRRADPTQPDGWLWKMNGARRVLYRLPETLAAVQRRDVIHIAEGEKDVAALVQAGFAATCNAGGAGKWRAEYSATLKGAAVVVIADKDAPGRKHAADVAASLQGTAASVRVIELPDTGGKGVKDAADFFAAGGTAADFRALCANAPEWTAPAQPVEMLSMGNTTPADALASADIRGFIIRTLLSKDEAFQQRQAIASAVVAELSRAGRLFHHAELRDFESAMYFNSRRKRLERIRSDAFLSWLSDWLTVNRADNLFRHIQAAVETAALSSTAASAILPAAYWHATPEAVYISNGDGQLVRLTSRGLELLDNGTDGVLFAAGKTLTPWNVEAQPADPFQTCRLFRDTRAAAAHGKDLLRAWVYSLPTNPRSKPPICLAGEIGSGKTRLAKGFAELYGLPFLAAKVEEEREKDFWVNVDQGGLYTLDNADTKCRWLADGLASAATDGCSPRRKLYKDTDTVVLRARAWLAVTTANPTFASDAGLADRLLLVRTHHADGDTSDSALSDEIQANRDAGLVHIAETLAVALKDNQPTPSGLNRRHPDFAAFAVRIGRALNREAETIAALQSAEADKSAFCLENDTIAPALLTYLNGAGTFTGTAAELRPHLIAVDPDLAERLSAKGLGKRLTALWPHLAKAMALARREQDRNKVWRFTFHAAGFAGFKTAIS